MVDNLTFQKENVLFVQAYNGVKHEQKSLLTAMTKPLWNYHQNGRLRRQVNKESHQAVDNKLPISDIIHNHIVPRLKVKHSNKNSSNTSANHYAN